MHAFKQKGKVRAIIVCLLALIIIVASFLLELKNANIEFNYPALTDAGSDIVGEIVDDVSIEQEIPFHAGDSGVSIEFSTYARKNKGRVNISIVGETSGFIYADMEKSARKFQDNSFFDIYYNSNPPTEDETLKISITSTSEPGHAVTAYTTNYDSLPSYSLIVNGEEKNADLVTRSIVPSGKKKMAWLILALILVCFVISMGMIIIKEVKIEKAFLIIALSLGLIYSSVMTPFSIPDELYHYQSTFRLSNVFCFQSKDMKTADSKYFDFRDVSVHNNVGSAYDRFINEIFAPTPEDQGRNFNLGGSLEFPLMLVPQAIGITICRVIGANTLITFYLGRLTNLLFYVVCIYFAIKKTPRFGLLFFLIGIMPMSLHQAASYSYDAYINGMAVLLLSCILSAIDGEGPIQKKEILSITIIGALLAPAKVVYATLLLLIFLIPSKRFPSGKKHIASLGIILCSAVALVVLFQLGPMLNVATSGGSNLNWEGGVNYSISDIVHQPLKMAKIYLDTFNTQIWNWYQCSIGLMMSGLTLQVKQWAIIVYGILLLLSSFSYVGEKATVNKERYVFLLTCFLTVFLTMFIFLISYTSNTHSLILGVQGRYFIPVLPLFFMSLNNPYIRLQRPVGKNILFAGVLVNFCVLQSVFISTVSG